MKPALPVNTPPASPVMAMVDYPADDSKGRFYVLLPAPPDRFLPAIRIVSGRAFPCYIRLTSKGDDGMIFSVGGEKQIARHFELQGIREALLLMGAVWKGVLDAHRPLDAEKVERLAIDLTNRPEASLAHVRLSGVIGKRGGLINAGDYVRNVWAFCYWKYFLGIYKGKQPHNGFTMFPAKGGRAWSYSAKWMNRHLAKSLPRAQGWIWTDFTEASLRSLFNNRGLFPPEKG